MAVRISNEFARAALKGVLGRPTNKPWTHLVVSLHTVSASSTQASLESNELASSVTGYRRNVIAADDDQWRENAGDNSVENTAPQTVPLASTDTNLDPVRCYAVWGQSDGTAPAIGTFTGMQFLYAADFAAPEPVTAAITLHAGSMVLSIS